MGSFHGPSLESPHIISIFTYEATLTAGKTGECYIAVDLVGRENGIVQ